jgi:hypothetical protein
MSDKQRLPYVVSPTNRVHLKSDINDGESTPDCGQTISGQWSCIFEEDMMQPEDIAEKYHNKRFCSKCFDRSYALEKTAREARADV